jgi:hypothetical protein
MQHAGVKSARAALLQLCLLDVFCAFGRSAVVELDYIRCTGCVGMHLSSCGKQQQRLDCVALHLSCCHLFFLVTRGGVTLLAGHTHQPDESECGGLQHCCH